jgi:hypothetical protein
MSDDPKSVPGPFPRRAFLRVLALAPVAAGCATTRGAASGGGPASAATSAAPAAAPVSDDALGPIRAFPLATDAEPAFVFRAAVARPQE